MGKLFWKFFFAFWLALLIAGLAVGTTIWLRHIVNGEDKNKIDRHQAALVASAENVFDLYGEAAFIDYLKRAQFSPGPKVYALSQSGHDILGRKLEDAFIDHARDVLKHDPDTRMVRELTFTNGEVVLLFVPDLRPKHMKADSNTWLIQKFFLGDVLPKPPPHLPFEKPHIQRDGFPNKNAVFPPRQETNKRTPLALFVLILAGLVAGFIFSFLLAWYFTRPINILRSGLSSIAAGKLETRLSDDLKKRNDELSDLGGKL